MAADDVRMRGFTSRTDLEEALEAANEGLSLKVSAALPHLHTSRGEVYYALRDFDKAIVDLDQPARVCKTALQLRVGSVFPARNIRQYRFYQFTQARNSR